MNLEKQVYCKYCHYQLSKEEAVNNKIDESNENSELEFFHSHCNKLMSDMSIKKFDGIISLPYFKQGDDFATSIAYISDKEKVLDYSKSLSNHIEMLRYSADVLQQIRDTLLRYELESGEIGIGGDTHMIWISGPSNVMRELVKRGLIDLYPPVDEL